MLQILKDIVYCSFPVAFVAFYFKKLRIDRSHGIAPHKPILLLSVLQAFQNYLIINQRIYITPELVALFKSNWSLLVITNHDCRISYPFYYLKSDKFWKLIPKNGFENINQMGSIMKSFFNLNAAIDFAFIDANKGEYIKYFDLINPKLKKGGIIAADNITSHPEKVATFVEKIKADINYQVEILDLPAGMLIGYKL